MGDVLTETVHLIGGPFDGMRIHATPPMPRGEWMVDDGDYIVVNDIKYILRDTDFDNHVMNFVHESLAVHE